MKYQLSDVYGMNRGLPKNYVTRKTADDIFKQNLQRKQHLVVYGSSKQGKTSLRKSCLSENEYIVVQCSNKWNMAELNSAILKQADFVIEQSSTKTTTGASKIFASFGFNLLGNTASGGADHTNTKATSITESKLELDPENVNDIIKALNSIGFKKYIILEDFHYLEVKTQNDFAIALKAFHENSDLSFIVIGVWLEQDRLAVYNGDLNGRLFSINADSWSKDELNLVITKGEQLLNIEFGNDFKEYIINNCFDSVYIVQDSCHQCCMNYSISETQKDKIIIGNENEAMNIVDEVVNRQSARFRSFITQFSDGFQNTELEMYKWILYCVLLTATDDLSKGLKQSEIKRILDDKHPKGAELNRGSITQALKSINSLQNQKGIKPIILDYDQTNKKLNIVDKSFLIWLSRQNIDELIEDSLDL